MFKRLLLILPLMFLYSSLSFGIVSRPVPVPTPVPEPSTFALAAFGLLGAVVIKLKKK
jgi:hypothetical protein